MIAILVSLSSQFKNARERLGLSQSQASVAWKVKLETLKKWEQGKRQPRRDELERLWPILFPDQPTEKK